MEGGIWGEHVELRVLTVAGGEHFLAIGAAEAGFVETLPARSDVLTLVDLRDTQTFMWNIGNDIGSQAPISTQTQHRYCAARIMQGKKEEEKGWDDRELGNSPKMMSKLPYRLGTDRTLIITRPE